MKEFNRYLDKIKADEDLKEKTARYVRMESAKRVEKEMNKENGNGYIGGGIFNMKKLVGAVFTVALMGLVALGGYKVYATPVAYVSMDINPSVELGLNFMNRVVSAEGVNEDGQGLFAETKLRNMSVEDAVQVMVQEASKQGYINKDGSSVVALTALANNEQKAEQLQERVEAKVQDMTKEQNMECVVYADHANLQLRTEAHNYDLSPGKYRLIQMLQALDPSVRVEQYSNAKVTDIMVRIHELLGIGKDKGNQLQGFENNGAAVSKAAEQIMKRFEKQDQNQNQNQVQNPDVGVQDQTRTQDQTQDQTQLQTQEPIQEQTQLQIQDPTKLQAQNK